jgi:hypothetical protein
MKRSGKKRRFVHYLAVYGGISTGMVYTAIGIIAILSFLKLKEGGADESSLLAFLDTFLVGRLLIWVILLGMVSYIIWRIYETIYDPYGYGKGPKGIARRAVTAFTSLADALIAFTAIQVLSGTEGIEQTGLPTAQQKLAGDMLRRDYGDWLIIALGLITCITAVVQAGYVISRNYLERLNIDHLSRWMKTSIHLLAWAGHFARGVILGITGYFFIKTGIEENPRHLVNTDKAFDFIGDHVGHLPYIIVATGTIAYGLFMFGFGIYYDSDQD